MLSELRKQSRSAIIYVLFGIIIAAFILTFNMGPMNRGAGESHNSMAVADVDGNTIDMGLLRMARLLISREQGFGIEMAPSPSRIALEHLVQIWLVSRQAEKLGMTVPEEDLAKAVFQNEMLKANWYVDGEFKKKRFNDYVRFTLNTTPEAYEEYVRRNVLFERMESFLHTQVSVSDAEVERQWKLENDKVVLEVVEFFPDSIIPVIEVSDADLAKALEERKDDIAKYYEDNGKDFLGEERAEIHGIFVKAPLEAADEVSTKARSASRQKAEGIRAKLVAEDTEGESVSFEDTAKTESDYAMNNTKGGAFGKPMLRKALNATPFGAGNGDAVFGLDDGGISEVLEAPGGFWVVRLDKKVSGEPKPLAAVQKDIARILVAQDRKEDEAKRFADEFAAKAKAGADKDLSVHVEAWSKDHPAVQKVTGPVIKAEKFAPFALVSSAAANRFGSAMPGSASGPWGKIAEITGDTTMLAKTAFALTPENPVADEAFEVVEYGVKHWYVVRLVERTDAPADGAEEAKKAAREALLAAKKANHFEGWCDSLLEKATAEGDIVETEGFLAQVELESAPEAQQQRKNEVIKLFQERARQLQGGTSAPVVPSPLQPQL